MEDGCGSQDDHDSSVGNENEGFEYVRYMQYETGERTDDGDLTRRALYEVTEQRNRLDYDGSISTAPNAEAA